MTEQSAKLLWGDTSVDLPVKAGTIDTVLCVFPDMQGRLADLRVPRGGGDNVHIDAAGYPNAAHAPSPGGTLIPGRIVAIIHLRQILR